MFSGKSRCRGNLFWCAARPAVLGLLAAIAVSLTLCAVFALVFVIIESIAESAVIPLSLLAVALGCFLGAYICAALSRCRGIIYGAVIGFVLFVLLWIIGLFCSDSYFGTQSTIKLIVLIGTGCCGGYLGMGAKKKRR